MRRVSWLGAEKWSLLSCKFKSRTAEILFSFFLLQQQVVLVPPHFFNHHSAVRYWNEMELRVNTFSLPPAPLPQQQLDFSNESAVLFSGLLIEIQFHPTWLLCPLLMDSELHLLTVPFPHM